MALATGLVSALLSLVPQVGSGGNHAPDRTCPSTTYGDAWGRTSPSGTFLLCRVPATKADVPSVEFELRAGAALQWRLRLPHALDEAVVSEFGDVDGFALGEERWSPATAYVVSIAPDGVLRREWRFGVEPKWLVCGSHPTPVTEIARVDASRIAVRTGSDELWILELDSAAPVRSFDLLRFLRGLGDSRRIAEWDVLPGAEVVAVRTAYSRYHPGTPTAPLGARIGGREDFGMRYSLGDAYGRVLWSLSEHCLTLTARSERTPLEVAAERAFRQDHSQRIVISARFPFAVDVQTSAASLCIEASKDLAGAWQARVVGGR